jgi:hypothetical protein
MVVFLFSVIRSVVRSRLWRWRSMSRIRLLLLVVGLAWHFRSAVRELRSTRTTRWRDAAPDRGWGPALSSSWGAHGLRRAMSTASRSSAYRRGADAVAAVFEEMDGELR